MHFRNNDNTSKKKDISDIKGLKIYGPVKNSPLEFQHLFLTSKDGEFDVCWFKLKFICEDKFRLNYRTVPIYKLMMDEVLNYQSSFSEERYIKNNVGKQFLKRM